jgi:hypothetical protein
MTQNILNEISGTRTRSFKTVKPETFHMTQSSAIASSTFQPHDLSAP